MDFIKENKSKINITLVPIANPFGLDSQIMWMQTWYNNINTNAQNAYNYNRLWEGNWWNFENAIVKTLLNISKKADIILDLHSAWLESEEHIYIWETEKVEEAEKFWIENIVKIDWKPWNTVFDDVNRNKDKKSFTLELWASRKVENKRIDKYKDSILNFLELKNSNKNKEIKKWNIDDFYKSFSPYWWILVWDKETWDYIKKWENIAKVYTKEWIKNITAEKDFYFLIKYPIHAVYSWQEIWQFLIYK